MSVWNTKSYNRIFWNYYFTLHPEFIITFAEEKLDASFLFSPDICVLKIKVYITQSSYSLKIYTACKKA